MLMMVNKSVWNDHKFSEEGKCLGVDTDYNRRIRASGLDIFRMDGLYILHVYRMAQGVHDKTHLL